MKKIFIIFVGVLLNTLELFAHDFVINGIYYSFNQTDTENTTVIVTYKGNSYSTYWDEYSGDIIIPETVKFNNKIYSVVSIGRNAFKDCSGVTSITLPNSIRNIGKNAFDGTKWFDNQPNGLVYINNYVYTYKGTMPENTQIELLDGTRGIAENAFYNCNNLISIKIPSTLKFINYDVFANCTNLYSVYISDVKNWCSIKLSSHNSNPMRYAAKVYINGEELEHLIIPEGITNIPEYAFSFCNTITSLTIGNNVKNIEHAAFSDCKNLSSIIFGKNVSTLGDYAFSSCPSLEQVTCLSIVPPVFSTIYVFSSSNIDIPLYVPYAGLYAYRKNWNWNEFAQIINFDNPSVTINSTGCTTFSALCDLDFSNVDDIKAYTATEYNSDNGKLTLVRIKEAKAGTGLYLSGNVGTYTIPTISSTAYNSLNMFVGVNEETTISTTDGIYTNYIYTKPTGKEAGFYKVTSDRAIPAGKAYLQIPTAWLNEETTSEAKAVKLVFDDGESTGIDEVNRVESKEEIIYDLQGRRVKNPSKGIYIINGKKVVR